MGTVRVEVGFAEPVKSAKSLLRDSLQVVAATLLVLGLAEGLIRVVYTVRNSMIDTIPLPYDAGQGYAIYPPWIDGLRILEKDEILLWRNRSSVSRKYMDVYGPVRVEEERSRLPIQFFPRIPDSLRGNTVWEISINSAGFRDTELPSAKAASAFRILCLGDSWTFGANVGQDHAYPQQLQALLTSAYPRADFEVLNLGVLGYSSFQGLRLLRNVLDELDPDLVTIGFGMNDANVSGWQDEDARENAKTTGKRLERIPELSEFFKLLLYLAKTINSEPPRGIGEYLHKLASVHGTTDKAWTGKWASETADYEALEPYTRVPPRDYEKNVREMIELLRSRGADAVLLYNQLWSTPYREILRRISSEEDVPLVDSKERIDQARAQIEAELDRRLDLQPPESSPVADLRGVEVVFRVHSGGYPVPKALSIVGVDPNLGNGVPNRVALYDNGTHGDQRAGDEVWSLAVTLEPGSVIFYVYANSGTPGRWEGLDVPDVRRFRVEASPGERIYRPIETFGQIYMQADVAHTNAYGYELIARDLLDVLKKHERVQAHLAREPAARSREKK